jgi:hypothetical protein
MSKRSHSFSRWALESHNLSLVLERHNLTSVGAVIQSAIERLPPWVKERHDFSAEKRDQLITALDSLQVTMEEFVRFGALFSADMCLDEDAGERENAIMHAICEVDLGTAELCFLKFLHPVYQFGRRRAEKSKGTEDDGTRKRMRTDDDGTQVNALYRGDAHEWALCSPPLAPPGASESGRVAHKEGMPLEAIYPEISQVAAIEAAIAKRAKTRAANLQPNGRRLDPCLR